MEEEEEREENREWRSGAVEVEGVGGRGVIGKLDGSQIFMVMRTHEQTGAHLWANARVNGRANWRSFYANARAKHEQVSFYLLQTHKRKHKRSSDMLVYAKAQTNAWVSWSSFSCKRTSKRVKKTALVSMQTHKPTQEKKGHVHPNPQANKPENRLSLSCKRAKKRTRKDIRIFMQMHEGTHKKNGAHFHANVRESRRSCSCKRTNKRTRKEAPIFMQRQAV